MAKGRRLKGPKGRTTRPATERMREAIFSSLGRGVEDASVLDLYAGTGSLGLEALSRGAVSVTFVERDSAALEALTANIEHVGLGGKVIARDVATAVRVDAAEYDLVFVDPPYALSSAVLGSVLSDLADQLTSGALVVLHRRRGEVEVETPGTLTLTDRRRYGDAEVWWYEKEAP